MEENQTPSTVTEPQDGNKIHDGIDFESISALANSDFTPEPFGKRLGYGILEKLLSLGLFILGFLLDIIKALWAIIKGFFKGIVGICRGVYRFFRSIVRMCKEGDKFVKMSTFCQGLGCLKGGQIGDGVVYLAVEIVFILFMVLFGGAAIRNFFIIGEVANGMELPNNTSVRFLVSGVLTFIVVAAYIFVWYSGMRACYDNYVIRHNFRFLQAHADQVYVLENLSEFAEFTDVATDKDGHKKVVYKKPREIRRIAREVYGFPEISARYISYIEFNHLEERKLGLLPRIGWAIEKWFYRGYDKVRRKIVASKWSSQFGTLIEWEIHPVDTRFGAAYVRDKALGEYNRFRHTYDKYNNYLSYVSDSHAMLKILDNPELLEKAIYAQDDISVKNGLKPLEIGSTFKPKAAASRVVGVFDCPFDNAVRACEFYLRALRDQAKTNVKPLEKMEAIDKELHKRLDDFIRINRTERVAGIHETQRLYASYNELNDLFVSGKALFIETLTQRKEGDNRVLISRFDARALYRDMAYAKKVYNDDPEKVAEYLALHSERFNATVERFETYNFHPQPMRFKRKLKQYTDEKFAVTVLSLPVLGALITCIIPLIASILIAFTDYYGVGMVNPVSGSSVNGAIGNFDWSFAGWQAMFSGNALGGGGLGATFMYILGWDLIWALFATFTNYILGIVLALLINKKSIKGKAVFRTLFVISIAIPQFITLLSMRILLGNGGPLHEFFISQGWATREFFWLDDYHNDGLSAKICLILVNVWIGIPYTMLSTSGILMNIPEDLYESASVDGATPWTQFWKITMPYILFVTGPSLLTTFIGNINNFNVIYFLTGGLPKPVADIGTQLHKDAGYTDLLITFLYKLTVNGQDKLYNVGSVIGILTFAICAFFSLIMYSRMGSTKNEEEFQ